jgi:hypothetical protein
VATAGFDVAGGLAADKRGTHGYSNSLS